MTAMLKQLETSFDAAGTPANRDECTPVAVIGGNAWFAATLVQVLNASGRFILAGTADCAATALRTISGCRDAIVLVSARIYDTDIAQTVRRIRQANPTSRVVLHLPAQNQAQLRDAMHSGAWGLCTHDDCPDTVLGVLTSVAGGRISFPYLDMSALDDDPFEQLSGREMEVLQALARGWSNMQISARLGISQNTVKYHLKLIYEKIDVPNRATAVARFMARQSWLT
jgi:DNA-binding NarL/FixJ family response regulator